MGGELQRGRERRDNNREIETERERKTEREGERTQWTKWSESRVGGVISDPIRIEKVHKLILQSTEREAESQTP